MSEKNSKEHTGEPSGANKSEGLGMESTPPGKMNNYLDATDKYTESADKLDPSIHVRHHNRNTSKGEDDDNAHEARS